MGMPAGKIGDTSTRGRSHSQQESFSPGDGPELCGARRVAIASPDAILSGVSYTESAQKSSYLKAKAHSASLVQGLSASTIGMLSPQRVSFDIEVQQ